MYFFRHTSRLSYSVFSDVFPQVILLFFLYMYLRKSHKSKKVLIPLETNEPHSLGSP